MLRLAEYKKKLDPSETADREVSNKQLVVFYQKYFTRIL